MLQIEPYARHIDFNIDTPGVKDDFDPCYKVPKTKTNGTAHYITMQYIQLLNQYMIKNGKVPSERFIILKKEGRKTTNRMKSPKHSIQKCN